MKNNDERLRRIEEVLDSLDGMERAEMPSFFYTRLMARFNREKTPWERIAGMLSHPAVFASLLAFVILLNSGVVYTKEFVENEAITERSTEEYNLGTAALYEPEILEP